VPVGSPSEEAPVPPEARLSDVLTALPPLDLAAVGRGMQRFLEDLEGIGGGMGRPASQTELLLWAVAGTAAGVACEVARRQLRRHAEAVSPDENQWTWAGL
jgi:hypothetical protein